MVHLQGRQLPQQLLAMDARLAGPGRPMIQGFRFMPNSPVDHPQQLLAMDTRLAEPGEQGPRVRGFWGEGFSDSLVDQLGRQLPQQ